MALMIYEYAVGDPGKGREMQKHLVEIMVTDRHELELYRELLKKKHSVKFVAMKHRQIK